jgi:hypothetical protein
VNAFVTGDPPELSVGDEEQVERDLPLIGSGVLALGLTIAIAATPSLELTPEEIHEALFE